MYCTYSIQYICTVHTVYSIYVLYIQYTVYMYCTYSIQYICTVHTAYSIYVLYIQHTVYMYCTYNIHTFLYNILFISTAIKIQGAHNHNVWHSPFQYDCGTVATQHFSSSLRTFCTSISIITNCTYTTISKSNIMSHTNNSCTFFNLAYNISFFINFSLVFHLYRTKHHRSTFVTRFGNKSQSCPAGTTSAS